MQHKVHALPMEWTFRKPCYQPRPKDPSTFAHETGILADVILALFNELLFMRTSVFQAWIK